MQDKIIIRGAKQHNLKNINIEIAKNRLIVFTGLSGSGKSSMAFDTIYAEGQRRYVESLSSYARQFLGVMDKPDVDSIDGLQPAISIDQKASSHNPRSTVGTITEIYDYLRLLFARIGHPHCYNCTREIERQTVQQITDCALVLIKKMLTKSYNKPVRLLIYSPVVRDRKGEFRELFVNLKSKGYSQVRIDGQIFSLDEDLVLIKTNKHSIDVVIDRVSADKSINKDTNKSDVLRSRLYDSIERASVLSDGLVIITEVHDSSFTFPELPKKQTDHLYSERFACGYCNISLPEIEPRIFSFNSPHGACPNCNGIGTMMRIDPQRLINVNLSISEGGILPFARVVLSDTWYGRVLLKVVKTIGIDFRKPLREAKKEQIEKILYGTGEEVYDVEGENRYGKLVTIYEKFSGIIPELERRFRETESEYVRHEIEKYLKKEMCPICLGKRLKKEALSVTISGKSIVDVTSISIEQTRDWVEMLFKYLSEREKTIGNLIVKEIKTRLSFLISVGLEYLTLDRSAVSLSGGEAQRIRLASQIGSGLSGVLYVLDEPSIGLHPRDNSRLITTLKNLRDLGNTVIVVEHDREIMENADIIYDFGPGAGEHGGKIVAYGSPSEIKSNKNSITGLYLSNKKKINYASDKSIDYSDHTSYLTIYGCKENNLKDIKVKFPLNKFISVTGVSGSGKSSLVVDILYHALARQLNLFHKDKAGKYTRLEGLHYIKRVVLIDQSPIGRTPRSNPATYTGAFNYIRDLFAQLPESRARGYEPGRFSFNVKGGRCEGCCGEGEIKIEMQFLPDVYVVCDICGGTRFNQETLAIRFKGKNIAEVLQMTVEEACSFFVNIPGLINKLETLMQVGLSYIRLGQPAPHLSGGEAQRVKLATELSKKSTRGTVFILDEPTTGLHFADMEKLLHVLRQLVYMGNTVIVIEHNLDIIKNSDWVIDLGPEGGDKGGYIIAEGNPIQLSKHAISWTGRFLKSVL